MPESLELGPRASNSLIKVGLTPSCKIAGQHAPKILVRLACSGYLHEPIARVNEKLHAGMHYILISCENLALLRVDCQTNLAKLVDQHLEHFLEFRDAVAVDDQVVGVPDIEANGARQSERQGRSGSGNGFRGRACSSQMPTRTLQCHAFRWQLSGRMAEDFRPLAQKPGISTILRIGDQSLYCGFATKSLPGSSTIGSEDDSTHSSRMNKWDSALKDLPRMPS